MKSFIATAIALTLSLKVYAHEGEESVYSDIRLISDNARFMEAAEGNKKKEAVMTLFSAVEKKIDESDFPGHVKADMLKRLNRINQQYPDINKDRSVECYIELIRYKNKWHRKLGPLLCENNKIQVELNDAYQSYVSDHEGVSGKIVFDSVIQPDGKAKVSLSSTELPADLSQTMLELLSRVRYQDSFGLAEVWDDGFTYVFRPSPRM